LPGETRIHTYVLWRIGTGTKNLLVKAIRHLVEAFVFGERLVFGRGPPLSQQGKWYESE
jgi:hypothetical protein